MSSTHKRSANLFHHFVHKKRKVHVSKQAFVWKIRGVDADDTGLFIMLNAPDANDGDLSIKEYMRKSEKYCGMPLLKRPRRNQYFAWIYKGQHKMPVPTVYRGDGADQALQSRWGDDMPLD